MDIVVARGSFRAGRATKFRGATNDVKNFFRYFLYKGATNFFLGPSNTWSERAPGGGILVVDERHSNIVIFIGFIKKYD